MYKSCFRGKLKEDPWVRKYDIKEVLRHEKGFTIYKVTSKIFPRNSIEAITEVVVWKRFSDFKKLHKALSQIHQGLHLKGIFPTFVKTQFFGRFDEKVIDQRRQSALCLLRFAADIPALYNSQVFVKFFEDVQTVEPTSDLPELEEPLQPIREEQIISEGIGGTWGHRREAEDLGSSSCSSSSSGSPLTPSDYLIFDPFAPTGRSLPTPQDSWLLSAIRSSCSRHNPSTPQDGAALDIFDFPRPFAEEEETEKQPSDRRLSREDPTSREESPSEHQRHLYEAAELISKAGKLESEGRHLAAFGNYKEAIGVLLNVVKEESDVARREAVARKTALYLARAEDLYERFLSDVTLRPDARPWTNSLPRNRCPRGDANQLARFKIVGIVGNVLLVRDTANDRIKVIKALWKSANSYNSGVPNIVPQNIPFMVALEQVYQTDDAIYMVLEYASSGRLWDGIASYLAQSPTSPDAVDCRATTSCNVYSGKKDSRVPRLSPDDPSSCNVYFGGKERCHPEERDVESLISSSKALLQTVDRTLNKGTTLPEEDDQDKILQMDEETNKPLDQRSRHLSSSTGRLDTPPKRLQQVLSRLELSSGGGPPLRLPETGVRTWASQMVVALSRLHSVGIIWQDLRPDNILLGDGRQVLLTYQSRWNGVDHVPSREARRCLYSAPEVGQIGPVTPACDWWSLGALLFELLTGMTLLSCHPSGITSHTLLCVPDGTSTPEAIDLLQKLLQFYPSARLGAGSHGLETIMAHPFFSGVDWSATS